jgi:hypothetical protein
MNHVAAIVDVAEVDPLVAAAEQDRVAVLFLQALKGVSTSKP